MQDSNQQDGSSKFLVRWLPLLVGIAAVTATLLLWESLVSAERNRVAQTIEAEMVRFKERAEEKMESAILALVRVGRRWETGGRPARGRWESDVSLLIGHEPGYQAIEWVDPTSHVRWIMPVPGNEAALDFDLAAEERRRKAMQAARDSLAVIVTRSIDLAQGGKGFRAFIPIYRGQEFDGFIGGVFRIQKLLDTIWLQDSGYSISVFDGQDLIYAGGAAIESSDPSWIKETELRLQNVTWRLRVGPTHQLLASTRSLLPEAALAAGLVMAMLLSATVFLAGVAYRRTTEAESVKGILEKQISDLREAERLQADLESKLAEQNRSLKESNEKLHDAHARLSSDLEAAGAMQRNLLPISKAVLKGVRFDWLFRPASFVAGDIFNFFEMDENNVGFYQLDVSGHGVRSAMMSVTLSKILSLEPKQSSPLLQQLDSGQTYAITRPEEVIAKLNQRFINKDDMYFTMLYGVLNTHTWRLLMSQAGHPHPIYVPTHAPAGAIGKGGFPVGMVSRMDYENFEITLSLGDRLFLYSDGIIECANANGELFLESRLLAFIEDSRSAPLREVMDRLGALLKDWRGDENYEDDISLLGLEVVGTRDERTEGR
jgi:sigma-B regulation protein RsbU (phosphoserine phosphatase)